MPSSRPPPLRLPATPHNPVPVDAALPDEEDPASSPDSETQSS